MKTNSKMNSGKAKQFILGAVFVFFLLSGANSALSEDKKPPQVKTTPKDVTINPLRTEMPDSKIYFGHWTEKITSPYCLDMNELIKNTQEYKEIKKQKIQSGTANYWIKLARASEVIQKRVANFANAKHICFIADRTCLLAILRRQAEFSSKSDAKLIEQFDLTTKIIQFSEKLDQLLAEKRKGKGLGLSDKTNSEFVEGMDPGNPSNKTDAEIIEQFDLINQAAKSIPD